MGHSCFHGMGSVSSSADLFWPRAFRHVHALWSVLIEQKWDTTGRSSQENAVGIYQDTFKVQ